MIEKVLKIVNWQSVSTQVMGYMPNILTALLLIIGFCIIIKVVNGMTAKALRKSKISTEARGLLQRFIRISMYIVGGITIIDQLGINVTSLIAGAGIAGLAISFAAQDTISNIIAGVAIVIDRPFSQGDWILIGDMHALVTEIRLRTTVLTTFDNETVVVPNKQLAQERIINYTLTPRIRCKIPVGIAYKENIQKARDVMLATVEGDERVLKDPAPVVFARSLGDSSVNLELRIWINQSQNKFSVEWEYVEKCKNALDKAGIEIPFPHMQLFVEPTAGIEMLAGRNSAS